MNSMDELFLHFLQDIYYAEKQGVKALAKIGKSVTNEALKEFLDEHRDETQRQITRLEEVYQQVVGKKARGKACAAMNGLIEEAQEVLSEGEKGPVLDAALIASVQAMKHYEIARIGALAAWAKQMGHDDAAETLNDILDEDEDADERLNEIAEEQANPQASEHGEEDDEDEEEDDEDDEDEDSDDEMNDEDEADEEEEEAKPAPARSSRSRKPAKT